LIDSIDLYEDEMEKEKDREEWAGTSDDETVLPMHDDDDELSNDGDADLNGRMGSGRKSIKGILWVILATTATLAGRRILRGGFREYLLFLFPD